MTLALFINVLIIIIIIIIIYNRLHTIPACDRQTDRQTSCHGIVRAMHTRRALKMGHKGVDYTAPCGRSPCASPTEGPAPGSIIKI